MTGVTPSITMMQGKSTTLLEMEYSVRDFLLVADSPWGADYQVRIEACLYVDGTFQALTYIEIA